MQKLPFTRRDVLKAAAAAAVGLIAGRYDVRAAAPEPTPVTPALIEAAKKEGKVVWYAAMDLPVSERVARAFEAKYPGIAVRIERTGSERQFQRLAQEYAVKIYARRHHQRLRRGAFRGLEAQRLARALRARGGRAASIPAEHRDPDGPVRHLARLCGLARLQHQPGEAGGRAARASRTCWIRNGWARWSRRIRPTAAPS